MNHQTVSGLTCRSSGNRQKRCAPWLDIGRVFLNIGQMTTGVASPEAVAAPTLMEPRRKKGVSHE